jgi:hypothetical protein
MTTLHSSSGLPQTAAGYAPPLAGIGIATDMDMGAVTLRHLRGQGEIASVLALRNEIDLSVHAGNPEFLALEKKETKSVSWAPSNCRGKWWAPFASCRWDTSSR